MDTLFTCIHALIYQWLCSKLCYLQYTGIGPWMNYIGRHLVINAKIIILNLWNVVILYYSEACIKWLWSASYYHQLIEYTVWRCGLFNWCKTIVIVCCHIWQYMWLIKLWYIEAILAISDSRIFPFMASTLPYVAGVWLCKTTGIILGVGSANGRLTLHRMIPETMVT